MTKEISFSDALQVIVGEKLSSVTFVMDYWQIAFDGHGLAIFTSLCVRQDGKTVGSGSPGFRDMLCAQISKVVTKTAFLNGILVIEFLDHTEIHIFARDDDYRGPEALMFQNSRSKTLYVV